MAKFSGRLKKAPVVFALCQLRFPPVAPVEESHIDAVHAVLRPEYPYRFSDEIVEFTLGPQGQQANSSRRHVLLDRRKKSGFIIARNHFLYRTADYIDFEHFTAQVIRGTELVFDELKPTLIDRVGLRYVDLIQVGDNESLEDFIEEPLRGFRPEVPGFEPKIYQQFVRGSTADGELIFRVSRGKHGAPLPPDLLDPLLVLRTPARDRDSIFIDIDHFKENADCDPKVNSIEKLVRDLQGPMSSLFKDAISEHAIAQWK